MFAVGLTGGIGSGKTTVADLFAARGVAVIDTDHIAHALTGPGGAAMPALRAAFGEQIAQPDGRLDRAAMRERVFARPQERDTLERILHPMISAEALRAGAAAATDHVYVMFAVPLLVESGHWLQRVDRVLVVDCDPELQIARVMARNGLTRSQVEAIMAAQATRAQRRAAAHDLIDNSGSTEQLVCAVDALHEKYCDLAREKAARTS